MPHFESTTSANPYLAALASSMAFSVAGLYYTKITQQTSPRWMNAAKTFVGVCLFSLTLFLGGKQLPSLLESSTLFFALSGAVGLAIADTFLMRSYVLLGPSKAMLLTRVQPVFLAIAAFVIFGQKLSANQAIAFALLMTMSFLLAWESLKKDQSESWDFSGIIAVLLAMGLDGIGILFSKFGFEHLQASGMSPDVFTVSWLRFTGALVTFLLLLPLQPIHIRRHLKSLSSQEKTFTILASSAGTIVAMTLWMVAVQSGKLGLISAIAGSGPLFAFAAEHFLKKTLPTKTQWFAVASFVSGIAFLATS